MLHKLSWLTLKRMWIRLSGSRYLSKSGLSRQCMYCCRLLDDFWEPHGSWAMLIPAGTRMRDTIPGVTHIICLQCVKEKPWLRTDSEGWRQGVKEDGPSAS